MSDVATSGPEDTAQELRRRTSPVLAATDVESPGAGGRRAKKAKKSDGDASGDGEKKSKKKLIILFVVLALVAFEAKGKFIKTHYKPGEKVPTGAIYALGSTTITTNLSDGHLAQVGISLQLTKPTNTKMIDADVPELTNSTIKLLSGETYSALLGPAGRAALSAALLSAYQQDLGRSEGAQQVTGVYFTTFVLQ